MGSVIKSWIAGSREKGEEEEREGQVILKALTQKEREFRKHCEEGHMIFRRDCRARLQGQMRSHIHRRQKNHGSNTFCLSMDLVGPWKPGKDHLHGQPVTRFLIAALSVPLPGGMDIADSSESDEREGESVEGWEEEDYEQEVEEESPLVSEGGPEFEQRRRRDEEAWRREAATLQDPVPTHDLIFCEPFTSKKSSKVLRAIQRVWVRIQGLDLTLRRLRTDGGREFCNRSLDAWALARDLQHTYSVPSDPKSNGRIENWVKHAKAGVRTLLCSQDDQDTSHWPSALRQWAEQRLRRSLKLLHVPDPIRPLPPYGTRVVVKNRQWTRKTPHDAKAMSGKVMCPAANIPNASVLLLGNGQFYVAPVVYRGVMEPVSFHGEIAPDILPAPSRRVRGKTSVASGSGDAEVEGSGFLSEGLGDAVPSEGLGDAVPSGGVGDAASGERVVMRVMTNLKGWFLTV